MAEKDAGKSGPVIDRTTIPGQDPLDPKKPQAPGEGIRSLRTSAAFRALNFELYARPVSNLYQK